MQMATEPMMMGSPVASPSSPGAHGQSPYLPAFLMGEPPAAATQSPGSRLWSASMSSSPPRTMGNKSGSWGSPWASTPPTGKLDSSVFHSSRNDSRLEQRSRGKEKTGAPPVQGLLESLHQSNPGTPEMHNHSQSLHISRLGQMGTSFSGTPGGQVLYTPGSAAGTTLDSSRMFSGRKTPPSPAQVDPFYTQGEAIRADEELDDTWVTVFGFPPAATSFILQQFSQYGNIVRHVVATEGNWMHLHYQSRLQAKKALSKNGKIFGGSIMVGVAHCIDKSVMDKDCDTSVLKTSILAGHVQSPGGCNSVADRSACSSIRPLTAAYRAASSDHEVVPQTNAPQKNSNPLSKAVEYMFGW